MMPPSFRKEVCKFIDLLNYYRDMWERRSHILAPVTKLTTSKVIFKRTKIKKTHSKKLSGLRPTIFY